MIPQAHFMIVRQRPHRCAKQDGAALLRDLRISIYHNPGKAHEEK